MRLWGVGAHKNPFGILGIFKARGRVRLDEYTRVIGCDSRYMHSAPNRQDSDIPSNFAAGYRRYTYRLKPGNRTN